jgi:hypothetical protein
MTAPAESISWISRPAAHFDAPAVSDRSVWAEPSRAWCVDAYRRSRVGRSPTRRRITCRTKVPVMKATTHSETPPPQSLWPRSLYPALTVDSCNHVDTHH